MSLEKGTRTRLTTAFILFLVMATGSVLGVAVDRRLEARSATREYGERGSEARRPSESGGGTREGGETPRRRSLIVEQVGLSDSQKAQVDSIVTHYRQRMRALEGEVQTEIQAAFAPQYRELLAQTRTEIKGVLSPGQQAAYDSLLVEHDRRRTERRTRDSVPGAGGQERD